MRVSFKNILIFFAFACILSGCVRGDVCFSSYKHIAGDYWRHGNPQAIIYERPDSTAICMDMDGNVGPGLMGNFTPLDSANGDFGYLARHDNLGAKFFQRISELKSNR